MTLPFKPEDDVLSSQCNSTYREMTVYLFYFYDFKFYFFHYLRNYVTYVE